MAHEGLVLWQNGCEHEQLFGDLSLPDTCIRLQSLKIGWSGQVTEVIVFTVVFSSELM